jgi:hypothetical protein
MRNFLKGWGVPLIVGGVLGAILGVGIIVGVFS